MNIVESKQNDDGTLDLTIEDENGNVWIYQGCRITDWRVTGVEQNEDVVSVDVSVQLEPPAEFIALDFKV